MRALAAFEGPAGTSSQGASRLVTGSRDATACVWDLAATAGEPAVAATLAGHEGFVTALAAVANGAFWGAPEGGPVVATGSRDKTVKLWAAADGRLLGTLRGHTEAVSGLAFLPSGALVSGALDSTLRVWLSDLRCEKVLRGHAGPVQCVLALPDGDFLSGSGDRTVKRWGANDLACRATYTGHTDTVRGLAAVPGLGFASASHDGTARVWTAAGEPVAELVGHTALVYRVAAAGDFLATASEDNSCRVWRPDGTCVQAVPHPGCVWDVQFLLNGDLTTACSDGVARLWTRDAARAAPAGAAAEFEAQVAAYAAARDRKEEGPAGALPEGLKLEPLEALATPGAADGEIKVVGEGGGAVAYGWSAANGTWDKIGDVLGGPGENVSVGRRTFEGQEYDFVFDVDVEDGAPPLQLPYNRGDNVYAAAERFIERNSLPVTYQEQVVNFILQNTADTAGGGGGPVAQNADPFTGGAAYAPQGAPAATAPRLFPLTACVTFAACPVEPIARKVTEFGQALNAGHTGSSSSLPFPDEDAAAFRALLGKVGGGAGEIAGGEWAALGRMLGWPPQRVFPVIDATKNAVLHPAFRALPEADRAGLLGRVLAALEAAPAVAPVVATSLRVLANAVEGDPGWVARHEGPLLDAAAPHCQSAHKNVRVALATLYVNAAVRLGRGGDPDAKARVVAGALEVLKASLAAGEAEGAYRALCAVGTAVHGDAGAADLAKALDLAGLLARARDAGPEKVRAAAAELLRGGAAA